MLSYKEKVLAFMVVFVGFGVVCLGETDGAESKERILHFPKERSLGRLFIPVRQKENFHHLLEWDSLGEAKGDMAVPAGKRLRLMVSKRGVRYLSWLSQLGPDDLDEITLRGMPANDKSMKYVVQLTGLKALDLGHTNVSRKGLQLLKNLHSLECLQPPVINDRGLAEITELKSLKRLLLRRSRVTSAGLKHLTKLKSLEEVGLEGEYIDDSGLLHLSRLPRLRLLTLWGNFSNAGMAHLKNIPSLKMLCIFTVGLGDEGLRHVSGCDGLESVSFYRSGNITDKGVEYLSKMKSLKRLDIRDSHITDEGVKYLLQIKSLEHLTLPPEGIGDRGLGYLSNLGNLRHLYITRIHYVDSYRDKGFYTDNGVKELSKLGLLEELHIGSLGLTDEGMDYICMLTNLKRLCLYYCTNVTNKGLAKLGKLKSLEHLDIFSSDITFSGLSAISNLPNLRYLGVKRVAQDGSGLDISGLVNLRDFTITTHKRGRGSVFRDEDLACLKGLTKLRNLQLCGPGIGDAGVKYLAGLTNLDYLNIPKSELTDEGLKYLSGMQKLYRLTIGEGKFTDKALEHIAELKMLRYLDITSENAFSNKAIRRLHRELPGLEQAKIMP